jgi:quinol monooxygenase YgiN
LCRGHGLAHKRRAIRVLSYLRMEIDPDQIEAHEEDLEERIQMARKTTGFLEVEVFQVYAEPNVSLVLGRWESHEAVRSFFMHERPMEMCLWVWSALKLFREQRIPLAAPYHADWATITARR